MITALLKLVRLYYSLPLSWGLLVITSYVAAGNIHPIRYRLGFSFLSLCSIISAGYVFNDICDLAVDAINCPARMLPQGKVTRKQALTFSIILFTTGLIFAAFCGWRFITLSAILIAGLTVYNIFSKKMGILKDILVAVLTISLYPLAFVLADAAPSPRLNALYIFPVWLFLTTISYEMLKDISDAKGDRQVPQKYFVSYCTHKYFLTTARTIAVIAGFVSVLPYALGYCKEVYLATAVVAIILALISTKHPPFKAIRFLYFEVFLVTTGSLADLIIYGP